MTEPKKRSLRIPQLQTLNDIKDEAVRLYRRAAKGHIDSADASRQANILRVAKECMVEANLEEQVATLRLELQSLQSVVVLEGTRGAQKLLTN